MGIPRVDGTGVNRTPFVLEEHEDLGKKLKIHSNFLDVTSYRVGKALDNSSAIKKDIAIAQKAIVRIQQSLHSAMMQDFMDFPDSELLPIYLGRLESPKGSADDK